MCSFWNSARRALTPFHPVFGRSTELGNNPKRLEVQLLWKETHIHQICFET